MLVSSLKKDQSSSFPDSNFEQVLNKQLPSPVVLKIEKRKFHRVD